MEQPAHGLPHMFTLDQGLFVYGFLIIVFLFNMLTSIPLGQLTSRLMLKKSPLVAYSWNLLGGFLEYNAMYFGYKSLYLLAIGMYVLAFLASSYGTGQKAKA